MAINLSRVNHRQKLIYALAIFFVSGCAAGPTVKDMEALKGRVTRLEKSLDESREKVDELDAKVVLLKEKLTSSAKERENESLALETEDIRPPADLKVISLSDGSISITALPGKRDSSVSKGASEGAGMDERPVAKTEEETREPARAAPEGKRARRSDTYATISGTPRTIYKKGYDLYLSRRYAEARAVFSQLALRYPQSSLADNAFFWSGEAYYMERNYNQAIENFSTVVKVYPGGNKAPDALLMMGLSYQNLGDIEKAVDTLKRLAREYPSSEAAKRASKRLKSLLKKKEGMS